MRALLQRVGRAVVRVEGAPVGQIGAGWLVLLGVGQGDDAVAARTLAARVAHVRAFADAAGRMNLSALDVGAEVLVVSQFTLYADLRRGRRPYFGAAAPPDLAGTLVGEFTTAVAAQGLRVASGRFGAMMEIEMVADGPVTLWLDSAES